MYVGTAGSSWLSGSSTADGLVRSEANLILAIGNSEKARLDTSGRLSVGTSSSISAGEGQYGKLQVLGNSSSATSGYMALGYAGAGSSLASGNRLSRFSFGANDSEFACIEAFVDATPGTNDYPGRLVFSTTADGASSPTERMRIQQNGDVLIGTTTSEGRITIQGDNCGGYIGAISNVNNSNCNPAHGLIFRAGQNGSSTGSNFFSFRRPDNTVLGSISQNGASSVAYNTSSDYRLKENIAPIGGAIDRILQLKPSRFNFITEPGKVVDGFIAHEAQAVVPECVTGTKDAVDDDGQPDLPGHRPIQAGTSADGCVAGSHWTH
jgi:hypothetical protein